MVQTRLRPFRRRLCLQWRTRSITASTAPKVEDCEVAGDLPLKCNRSSTVARERDREPDGGRDRGVGTSHIRSRTITASGAPKEEDCNPAGDPALKCNPTPLLVWKRDQELDGRRNWEPGIKHQARHLRRKTAKLQAT